MIDGKKVVTLVPARSGSKRLQGKNTMELCGRPLLGWPIQAALQSRRVDRVIVSTDDAKIAAIAEASGAEAPFLRPPELSTDGASSASVIEHALDFLQDSGESYDYLVLLEPTSPLTEAADVDGALALLDGRRSSADAIVGVSKVEAAHPVFDVVIGEGGLIRPYLSDGFAGAGRRQDISDLYYFDGSLYISDVNVFRQKKAFYHDRTLPYIMPKWKAFEVDDMIDFVCIEAVMRNRDRIAGKE